MLLYPSIYETGRSLHMCSVWYSCIPRTTRAGESQCLSSRSIMISGRDRLRLSSVRSDTSNNCTQFRFKFEPCRSSVTPHLIYYNTRREERRRCFRTKHSKLTAAVRFHCIYRHPIQQRTSLYSVKNQNQKQDTRHPTTIRLLVAFHPDRSDTATHVTQRTHKRHNN
jgi:hypothetical protein